MLVTNRPWLGIGLAALAVLGAAAQADEPRREALGKQLAPYYHPPEEFANQLGEYRSPLVFADGRPVQSAGDWVRRRKEIAEWWQRRLGRWPPLVDKPEVKRLEKVEQEGY